MARNKDIGDLINGIIGKEPQPQDLPKETAEALRITPEMEEQLNAVRRANVGRPSKHSQKKPIGREHRATFIVDKDLIRKVKYISLADSKLLKDVISEGLTSYVEEWEKKNGVINLPKR